MSADPGTADILRGASLACRFFSRVFHEAPGTDFLSSLREQGLLCAWPLSGEGPHARLGLDLLAKSLEEETPSLIKEDFTALFIGPVNPLRQWESTWTTEERLLFGAPTQAVRECYARLGMAVSGTVPEDHIALELEFLGELLERAAQAQENGDAATADAWTEEAETFFAGHLGRFAGSFLLELGRRAATDFYRGAALLFRATLDTLETIHPPRPAGQGPDHD
jgi:TorA maturation chaperone TorD